MIFILPLFFIEIFLGLTLTRAFGFWNTFLIYFVPTFLGLYFFTLQSQLSWLQFQKQMAQGQAPDKSITQMTARFAGTVLWIIPSFVCRFIGLIFLFPITRTLATRALSLWFSKKMAQGSFRVFTAGSNPNSQSSHEGFRYQNYDFQDDEPRVERDAKVIDIEAKRLPSPEK